MKKIFYLIILVTLFCTCTRDEVVSSITLSDSKLSLEIDQIHQLTVKHSPSHLSTPNYLWTSSNNEIVKVDRNGNITALDIGEAIISVEAEGLLLSAKCNVIVNPVEAHSIELSQTKMDVPLGDSIQLEVKLSPDNVTDKIILWSSNDTNIAEVTDNGLVKCVGLGKTIVTAKSGTVSAKCEVNVFPVNVTSVELSHNNVEIEITDTIEIIANVQPQNASNKKIKWESLNDDIATVDSNGFVIGMKEGKTTINAITEDGNFKASCDINVKIKGITVLRNRVDILHNTTEIIEVFYSHNNEPYLNATWEIANPEIATLTPEGKGSNRAVLRGLIEGDTYFNVYTEDGSKSAGGNIRVRPLPYFIRVFSVNDADQMYGYLFGSISSKIKNESNSDFLIKTFYIVDNRSFNIIFEWHPDDMILKAGESVISPTLRVNPAFEPYFIWEIIWNNIEYTFILRYPYGGWGEYIQ